MTALQILDLVDEAVTLDRSIAALKDRQKELKRLLVELAAPIDGQVTEGGGKSVAFDGRECLARVVFPGPKLISSLDEKDARWEGVNAIAGAVFWKLFRKSILYKPVPDFRVSARSILRLADAEKIIQLCERVSDPTVSFEVTEKFGRDFP